MSGLTHEFQFKLPVSQDRAFAALTEADHLESWFAEHVEVEPKPSGTFRFWGKHTYGVPTRAQATQQLLRFEKPKALEFTWIIHDRLSQVSLSVDPDPEDANGAIVKGKHVFAVAPPISRAKEMVDDLWRLQMGNLQTYLQGSGGVLMPDYTDPAPQVRASILINAPRERVFRALLEPELLNKWIAAAAEVEPRIGGRYSLGWKYDHGGAGVEGGPTRILDLVENEKLVIDWPDWRGDQSVPKQQITWLLESVGAQTRVTLIHSNFVRTVDISDYPFGWSFFLERLQLAAEGKEVPAAPIGC